MAKEIAVLMAVNGETAPMDQGGLLRVYRRQEGSWQEERSMPLLMSAGGGLAGLRKQLAAMVNFLDGCRVVVASAITGVPYYELEKAGCSLWEMQGAPTGWLDEVLAGEELQAAVKPEAEAIKIPVPEEVGEGRYRISISEVQRASGGITSKQVLQPWLQGKSFSSLEIVCTHVPPWLECEWQSGGSFAGEKEKLPSGEWKVLLQGK